MTFQIFATVFIVLAIAIMAITPTKFGIWSKYEVKPGDFSDLVFVQRFHVFGIRWDCVWYGFYTDAKRVGLWIVWRDDRHELVSEVDAKWLTRLTREALRSKPFVDTPEAWEARSVIPGETAAEANARLAKYRNL